MKDFISYFNKYNDKMTEKKRIKYFENCNSVKCTESAITGRELFKKKYKLEFKVLIKKSKTVNLNFKYQQKALNSFSTE